MEKISKSRLRDTTHRLVYEPFQTDCPDLHATWGQKTNALRGFDLHHPGWGGGGGTHHREDYRVQETENQPCSSMENLGVWNNSIPCGFWVSKLLSEELSLQSMCTERFVSQKRTVNF